MDTIIRTHLENILSSNTDAQNTAYYALMEQTNDPVDWAYEAWDGLVAGLTHKDNHVRAISAQLLSNLAKSDPEQRIIRDFEHLLKVTKDERFVTARHCLLSLWKIGVVGKAQQNTLLDGLTRRYQECVSEKNGTLIRSDILQNLRNVYDSTHDDTVKKTALELLALETDPKYHKKYSAIWR